MSLRSVAAKLSEMQLKEEYPDVEMEDDEAEPAGDMGDATEEKAEGEEDKHQSKKMRTDAEEGAGSGR